MDSEAWVGGAAHHPVLHFGCTAVAEQVNPNHQFLPRHEGPRLFATGVYADINL